MTEKKRHASPTGALTFAMVLIATQNVAKLILPDEWMAEWTMWHIVGVSALLALAFYAVMRMARSRAAARDGAPGE